MSGHHSLWDYVESGANQPDFQEDFEKDQVRKKVIKRLRASGHWMTLLRVARTIPQPFTLNDISVAVWKDCPEFFGMKGYPYPDNHKVHYILYGDRGLIAKGMVMRVQQGLFCLPDHLDVDALAHAPQEVSEAESGETPADESSAPAGTDS